MIVLFIVIGSEVWQCVGVRWCDGFNAVELTRMWEVGLIEAMFETTIASGIPFKIYRRLKDKFRGLREDRQDKKV